MKASDYRQHAQYCRDLAKHTPPGEPREQLLEIAQTWDTLAVEKPEWVQQHLELAPGEHQNEDALEDGDTSVPQPSSAPPLPF